ncbi:hypothetical protein DVK02_06480 [Halobellus sp. Atlit-31R]|nr:hypothetical protein DVK02_06480 [Halobellus sp. Atlit-31R]
MSEPSETRSWPPAGLAVVAALTALYGVVFLAGGALAGSVISVGYGLVLAAVAYFLWIRHRRGWWGAVVVYGLGALVGMSNILVGDSRFAVVVVASLLVLLYLFTHYEYFFQNAAIVQLGGDEEGDDEEGSDDASA